MYFVEWLAWKVMLETEEDRKNDKEIDKKLGIRATKVYEEDNKKSQEAALLSVSETPRTRGPVYAFNDRVLEIRCGAWEARRGLLTIIAIPIFPIMWLGLSLSYSFFDANLMNVGPSSVSISQYVLIFVFTCIFPFIMCAAVAWFYIKYGLRFSRMEALTSRHLLVRFNRITQQVHLHRPKSCGGLLTLPWKGIIADGTNPKAGEASGVGITLALLWPQEATGLPFVPLAFVGKAADGNSQLCDEWEFIRRFMTDGPQGLPRPRITSHFPWPWQALTPQFEGSARYFKNSGWLIKLGLVLISPAFLIIGAGHWLSLLLCWKPRWPKVIREAGLPGKPVPPLTTLADYPPDIQERLLANAHLWAARPGARPVRKPRKRRVKKAENATESAVAEEMQVDANESREL